MAWGRKREQAKPDQRALVREFLEAEVKDDPKRVRELLKAGLDLQARYDGTGRAALHLCAQGGSVPVAEVLIEHGADVKSLDPWGLTTVAVAARWGRLDVLRYFLERGVDPNFADQDGTTPLLHAMCAQQDRADHVRVLLEHGADPDQADDTGRTARDLATTLSQLEGRAGKGYAELLPPQRPAATRSPRSPRRNPTAADLGVRMATSSERLPDARLLADMFEPKQDLGPLTVHRLESRLSLRGRLVASDYLDVLDQQPFAAELPPGEHAVHVVRVADEHEGAGPVAGGQERTAFVRVQFTSARAARWAPARLLGSPSWYGFGVDHGMAALFDESARDGLRRLSEDVRWPEALMESTAECGHDLAHVSFEGGSAVICATGWGDGFYKCYLGIARDGSPCCFVADFEVLEWSSPARGSG